MRRGRVLADWGTEHISPTKSRNSRRRAPLPASVDAALRAMRKQRAQECLALGIPLEGTAWLSVDEGGIPVHPTWYSRRFQDLCAEAGVPVLRLHEARHTAATVLRERGIDTDVAAAFLGHDPVVYESTYVKTSPERVQQAANALDY